MQALDGRAVMTAGKHILIVDDYPDALEMWAIYLRAMGYEVSTAGDGLAALAQAERLHPDVIVLDLELPRMSGFDVARRLRANPETEHIPLIAATGYPHVYATRPRARCRLRSHRGQAMRPRLAR